MLCSHFTQNCILLYFLKAKNPYFGTKDCWKSSYICVFILSKKRCNWFHKNLHNSGMVGRRKLPDPSLNRIFNALSIDVQYTLSFQWTNFGLKCLQETRKGARYQKTFEKPDKIIYFDFDLNNVDDRMKRLLIYRISKPTIEKFVQSQQWRHQNDANVFIVNCEYISHLVLVFLLLTLSR